MSKNLSKKYKAVVIGCGKIGAEENSYQKDFKPATHAAAYLGNPKIELAGLCDIDPVKLEKAGKLFPGVPLYSSAKKMLQESGPDIVSVATPAESHYEFVKMAASFGVKAIVCEKPISDSTKKANLMVDTCKEKKCLLFIGHLRHFDPLITEWQEKIKKGLLGQISQVDCIYHNGFLNNGTHIVDLLIWFLGEAEKVIGIYNHLTSEPKKGKNIDAIIFFKNGARASLQSVSQETGLTEWVFYGKKGNFAIKNKGFKTEYKSFKKIKLRSLMAPMVLHVVSCLERKEKPVSTGQDGLAVLRILSAIEKSAKNGSRIVTL